MANKWRSSMDKQPSANAFTLLETLFVLFLISMLTVLSLLPHKSQLEYFSKKLLAYSVLTQEKAFSTKETKEVRIEKNRAFFDDIEFKYPQDITCTPFSFHYNARGNISQAKTIECTERNNTISIIYQLGSGRVRLE